MDESRRAARAWTRQQTRLERRRLRPAVGLGLLGTAAAIGQAYSVAVCLGAAFAHRVPPFRALLAFVILAVFRALLNVLVETSMQRAGAAARSRLRRDVLDRLVLAGPALLRGQHSSDLASVIVDRIESLDGLFRSWLPASILAVASPLVVMIVAMVADPVSGFILLGAGVLVPVGMALSGIGAAAATRKQFLALARLQARFLDRVRGIATIVLANQAEAEASALAAGARELRRRTMRVLRMAFLSSAVLDCAAAGALVLIALRGGALLFSGAGTISSTLFVLLLVPEFFAPLRTFSAAYQDRMHANGAAEAMLGVPVRPEPIPAMPVRTVEAHGLTVAFDDVSLVWDPARGPALDGVSFRVPAGETLVLMGPSGAGKSSVIEILLGFVRPGSGRVTLNGADIASIVPQALSRLTAWIGQRPMLFAGSIRENIRFAKPEATDAEIEDAARAARVDAFAADLPDGLETMIGEGGFGLSGGQAQRVAIARAFLKNAPLLLLDEPTTHLDPATEREVLDSLHRLALGRTVILASHSAAAQSFSGRRLELRDGKAVSLRGVA